MILTCKLGEILGGEILPAMNGEMIRHSFTLKHGEWDFFPCLMVKITPFRLHSEVLDTRDDAGRQWSQQL